MAFKSFLLWFSFSLLCHLSTTIDQASFYGSSYISLPFKEAKSSTDLHFKFKTILPNALILLIAGTTDYCIIQLENGRIKINMNLGAGEAELFSQQKLNDLKWHEVAIIRKDANLSMIIDNTHKVQKILPGRFFELNIHYGVFLGGHGNFTEIFFGHLDNFRGCLSEVKYNDIMVLEQARLRQQQSVVQRITWNCAAEFSAPLDSPISFVQDDAYMLISNPSPKEIKLQFELKTIAPQGLLFYNTGHGKIDFFLVEIWQNNIRCVIKSDSRRSELVNTINVSDGGWHSVLVHLTSTILEIRVDGKIRNEKNPFGYVAQLADSSYLGGLEANKRSRAMAKGCKSCDVTFKGCLRNFVLADSKKGLPDAYVSEGLLPGCVWHYPCLQNPCKDNGVCLHQSFDSFQCQCQEEFCLKANYSETYKVFTRNSVATDLELLSVEPLEVLEGRSVIITNKNLYMILDYHKYGIKDSGVHFYITEGPEHGSVTIDIWPHEKKSFSLLDVARDKVFYIHDGSEFFQDHLTLEVDFTPEDGFILPGYLQGRFKFTLSVAITPVNDAPTISDNTVLRIVQGSRKIIDEDIFNVKDPDTSPDQIIFNILQSDCGHFENKLKELKVTSFSQEQVLNREIVFIHNYNSSLNESYISLQVSDGLETNSVTKIRVSVTPQYLRLENNTGLVVLHQTSSLLTPFNLSFISNVADVDHKIQFHIVKNPLYGKIEVERTMNSWESSDIFTNVDLKQHRVRYRHLTSKPDFDEFQFRLSQDKTSMLYTFRLTFAKCSLVIMNTNPLLLNGTWEAPLLSKHLSFQTRPIKTVPTSIHYVITKAPTYGFLFFAISKYKLRSCDLFSQEDILSQNIKYKFHKKPYSLVNDSFSFIVLSPGCNNITQDFNIVYFPSEEIRNRVKLEVLPLSVDEGSTAVIDSTNINLQSEAVTNLVFNITKNPRNGFLIVKNRNNTNFFTLSELKDRQLSYQHDNTETQTDGFEFSAQSISESEDFQYVHKFDIRIILKNDNNPVRAIDQIFHVVVGGMRTLTGNDLRYTDEDLNTSSSDIVYTSRESPNGNFYFISNQSNKITGFSQNDIDNGRILFKHKGPEYAKVRLWVTDGHFHVNGALEIQASAPFIHIQYNKKLIMEQGSRIVLNQEHLSYTTNVFASDSDVIYENINPPTFGRLTSADKKVLQTFTQEDINLGRVFYINDVSSANADEIGLRVKCKDAVNVAQLGVWLLPSSYWEPFQIRSNNKMTVEESTSAIISKTILEVYQMNVVSSSIIYYISQPPDNGYITVLTDSAKHSEASNVAYFTQDLIDENRVLYIQSVANQTRDSVVLNVSNGMIWHNNLELSIEIIPEHVYMGSNNVTINEGGVVTLAPSHFFVLTGYYKSKINEYVILRNPKHGCVQLHKRCIKLNAFSHKELLAGMVQYAHDGSEHLFDDFEISAIAKQKRSVPVTVFINILPINDQKPKLVNNTGLVMWEGGIEIITNQMLAAVDEDRPGDTLKYHVMNCWWGSLSLKSDLSTSIIHFTQELIDKRMIVFQNQNGSEAKFTFNISDGLHTTKEHTFQIKTKAVRLKLHQKPLHIFPLQRKYLTSFHLMTVVSDPSRVITYEIVSPPTLGRLMMESESRGIFQMVTTFTQNDLNNSQIFYEHTHQFSDLYANDSFVFNVKAHLAHTLRNQRLKIDISVSSGGLDAYVNFPKIAVNEGGVTNVPLNLSGMITFLENHSGLRAPIIHVTTNVAPLHGHIFLQDNHNASTFTQQQLESGQVYYEHDHSDSLGDNLHFAFYLIPGYIALCNVTVPIVINPINDQPFHLVTPAPSLTVVQGENYTISIQDLATEDADTPPPKIKYDVISGPSQGRLILLPEQIPVMYFTQEDVNNGKLVYLHTSSVLKDSFHLRVWDGKFRPQFTLFNIIVTPMRVNITAGLPLYLQQGSDVVFLSEKQFFIQTNINSDKIRYRVKREPKHGVLYVKDKTSLVFNQTDLVNDNVMYLQTDMTTANDSFCVVSEVITGNTSIGSEIELLVKVQPLMQTGNFTVVTGDYSKITLKVLDATSLAKLTNSNPRYTILNLPEHSQVRKVIRSSGEQRNIVNSIIDSFTHEQVQSGLIYLAVEDVELPWDGLEDRLVFLLSTSIFQPAIGELRVHIKSSLNNDIQSTLAGPSDPAGHEGGLHFASPNMTRDYFLIVSMVAGVVILGIAVIVIIKCRSFEVDEMNKEEQCMQPKPLPRPPDTLLSSPSPLKQNVDGFTSSTLSTALPQCKVTALSSNEGEPHACYPYGVDEHSDDWSSCDGSDPTSNSKNIMLRRNQYWV